MNFYTKSLYRQRPAMAKILLVMRLIVVLLTTAILQVSAAGYAQKISLSKRSAPLIGVFNDIRNQSGYDFVFTTALLESAKPVSINVRNTELKEVLDKIFENQPLTYSIEDKTVVVSKKESSLLDKVISRFQAIDVRGKVVDEQGEPLVGATISVKGSNQQTKTDGRGNFYLQNVDNKATLVVSFVGFKMMKVDVKEDVGTLILSVEDSELKEIVVAYGKVQEKFATSNVGVISGDVISRQPVSNPLIALQGRVPGVFIQQTSGLNTGAVNLMVQGRNSMFNSNDPFYVIDGVPYIPTTSAAGGNVIAGSISSGGGYNNLNFINPNEIESITVLKDADATAIYGSRAANGAILITTKKGKAGKTKVDLSMQNGWGRVASRLKVLNTEQYIALKKEAYANANQPIPATAVDINGTWDPNRNIDWQKELLGETAGYRNIQASVSGGSEHTQFLAGAGYIRETPVFKGDFSNVRTSVNFNVIHASENQKFRFFLSGSYLEGNNQLPTNDITERVYTLAPNAPDIYNPDGTINWAPVPGVYPFQSFPDNPAANLATLYTNKTNNLVANSSLSYEIIPGLTLKSTFGYNSLQNKEVSKKPFAAITPESMSFGSKPLATFGDKSFKSWIIEPQASFTKTFAFGTVDALLGSTFQSTESHGLTLRGSNYTNDAQLEDFHSAGTKSTLGSLEARYNYTAIFGRLNYRLKDKYIVNLAARRDGSSRFGSENLFHSFYSIGGAWLFAEESIFKKALPFLSSGKLRVSYGTTGNDQIGDYMFYTLYSTPFDVGVNYLGVSPLVPDRLPNPHLQWEETRKLNFGVDVEFLNNKLAITANYFRNRSSNQLLSKSLSFVTGFGSLLRNLPALVQNTGWEFNLNYTAFQKKDFSWTGSFNITIPNNKLLRYDGLDKVVGSRYAIGQSINLTKVFSFEGVNPETGIYQFRNLKGELTSAPVTNTDDYVFITTDPKWYGGFNNTLTYKGFSLDVFFNLVSQMGPNLKFQAFPYSIFNTNYLDNVTDHWKKAGDNTELQKISANPGQLIGPYNAARNSNGAFERITYARLNNAVLSYTLNNELIRRIHLSNARLFVQGQNLFTITNYRNGDPGTQRPGNLGLLRMYSVGAQLSF